MRIDQLESLGVSFSYSFPHIPCCRLKKFPPNPMTVGLKRGKYPLFKRGILFTNKNPKGMVLDAFLKHLAWIPERIIFIDDRFSFLEDVQKLCVSKNIPFSGFLYCGMDSRLQKADEETARLQLEHFEKHLIWLSDEKAKRILRYTKPSCLYCKHIDSKGHFQRQLPVKGMSMEKSISRKDYSKPIWEEHSECSRLFSNGLSLPVLQQRPFNRRKCTFLSML